MKFLKYCLSIIAISAFICGCEDDADSIIDKIEPGHGSSGISIVSFGNPNVSKAVEDPNVQIANLKINGKSGLSYSYTTGNLSVWGLSYDAAGALAVAGYEENGKFYCAKFDWVSSSRRTRDFANINSGYNGWNPEKFYSAKKRCFFIMSENGKKRTNIITD